MQRGPVPQHGPSLAIYCQVPGLTPGPGTAVLGWLANPQVEILLVGVGDGLQHVGLDPLRAEAAVDGVVEDDQAEHGDRTDVPPERQVVVDPYPEDGRVTPDVAAAEDGEDRQANDPGYAPRPGPEVDRSLGRVDRAGDEVEDQEEDHGQVQLDHVHGPAPVDDEPGDDEAERGDDGEAGDLVGALAIRVAPAQRDRRYRREAVHERRGGGDGPDQLGPAAERQEQEAAEDAAEDDAEPRDAAPVDVGERSEEH